MLKITAAALNHHQILKIYSNITKTPTGITSNHNRRNSNLNRSPSSDSPSKSARYMGINQDYVEKDASHVESAMRASHAAWLRGTGRAKGDKIKISYKRRARQTAFPSSALSHLTR
jgi:hypothetical protein